MDDLSSYKGNSHGGESPVPKKERSAPIISSPPRVIAQTNWSRFKDLLFGQDARSVGSSVVFDVVLPAVKDLVFEVVTEGASRSLYGDSRPGGSRHRTPQRTHTAYNRVDRRQDPPREKFDRRDRAVHNFDSLVFRNAGEAEAIADHLYGLVEQYGVATVNDFYDAAGITGDFTDSDFGWTGAQGLRGTRVRRVRDGYILEIPRPRPID